MSIPCFFKKTHPNAVTPTKSKEKSRGYDLTLVDIKNQDGLTTFYTTGLILEPSYGWVYDIYPRSGISKTGYMLANSVGIVESDYRGEIIVALTKVDQNKSDLELPFRIAQVIFRREEPEFEFIEKPDLDTNTDRGSAGFGSSGYKPL